MSGRLSGSWQIRLVCKSGPVASDFVEESFSTRAGSKGHLFSLERQSDRSFLCFDVDEAKVWKAKKSRDKLIRHLVGSPCCHLSMNTRKIIPHQMFFCPHYLVKSQNLIKSRVCECFIEVWKSNRFPSCDFTSVYGLNQNSRQTKE